MGWPPHNTCSEKAACCACRCGQNNENYCSVLGHFGISKQQCKHRSVTKCCQLNSGAFWFLDSIAMSGIEAYVNPHGVGLLWSSVLHWRHCSLSQEGHSEALLRNIARQIPDNYFHKYIDFCVRCTEVEIIPSGIMCGIVGLHIMSCDPCLAEPSIMIIWKRTT